MVEGTILILLQQNISNKSPDFYIELRSNISSLLLNKHIDSRYICDAIYTYVFDIFRFTEWELYLTQKSIATNDTSLRKEGGGPSYLNFIQTECHKRDKKWLL